MSNYTPATATPIAMLPFAVTVPAAALQAAPASAFVPDCYTPAHTVWYVYTPPVGTRAIGASLTDSSNNAAVSIWTGSASAPTQVTIACQVIPGSIAVAVTGGTAYYLALDGNVATVTADVTLDVVAAPAVEAPIGSALITNDTPGGTAVVLDPIAGTTLQVYGLPSSEMGDVSSAAVVALLAEDPANANLAASFNLYTPTLGLVRADASVLIANQSSVSSVRTDGARTFYLLCQDGSSAPTLKTIGDTGALGSTWTLPINGAASTAMAPNRAGTIVYYQGGGGASHLVVHAYDLVGHAPLTDLVDLGASLTLGRDLLVTAAGLILVAYKSGTTAIVKSFNAAGSLQHTYTLGTNIGSVFRIALGLDDPLSFWSWRPTTVGPAAVLEHILVSDGSTISTVTVPTAVPEGDDDAPVFAPSHSCPLLLLRADIPATGPTPTPTGASTFSGWTPILVSGGAPQRAIPPPPGPTITVPMRRVRIAPHLSALEVFQFWDEFQVDAQFLATLDAPVPVLYLAYSDDGGYTWSQDLPFVAGPPGNYVQQFKWWRLGRSRNRVFKIWTDSPILSAILGAYYARRPGRN